MNLSKYLVLLFVISNCYSFSKTDRDIEEIQKTLAEKAKVIEEAKTDSELFKAIKDFTRTASKLKRKYLNLP
jgi:hypothetical protein